MSKQERITRIVSQGDSAQLAELADEIARAGDISLSGVYEALDNPSVRRWVRDRLLERLDATSAQILAGNLLNWPEDFDPDRRDRTTANVVAAISSDQLWAHLSVLAGGNAASALWDRLAGSGESTVMEAVAEILRSGSARVRETTLHMLVLDPYGPEYLSREKQDSVLVLVLDDPDAEIRGLAAEVISADVPGTLLERWDTAPLDESERVRMAFWRVALIYQPDWAIEAAGALVLDLAQPLPARRTALLSLGENISTRTVAPVLQAILHGNDQALAEDAAQLMWRHHRAPDIANAASGSQFPAVRELAERLLHPEMGSPAAGGSRPGDPTKTTDLFEQIRREEDHSP